MAYGSKVALAHDGYSEVAHKFGFTHLGRFSTAYQKFFREYPSATLKTPVPAFD
ncbi:helix-turn-helix domain-containing protein [Marinicauda algicola]|uniref:Helix-turn-helix domain-containing protein n=1 Tax=Marinicauda algicola TaxID=2029849 RepID=A0A4V3RYL2_9PROT|nr:helix-turn-helix domain-containing protein [Marinicauda algicola]